MAPNKQEMAYLDLKQPTMHHMLRVDHYERLSRNAPRAGDSNVLRDETINMANVYSTFNYEEICHILACHKSNLLQEPKLLRIADTISRTGGLIIPYYGNKISRIRTDLVEPKYMSPFESDMPPYLIPAQENPKFHTKMRKVVIEEAAAKLNLPVQAVAAKADYLLNQSKFDHLCQGHKDPNIPMLVVEGEFKALAIYDSLLDLHRDYLVSGLSCNNWSMQELTKIPKPPVIYTVGIGGVWNMVLRSDDHYKLRPELSTLFPRKSVLICFDSDYKYKHEVCLAAATTAKTLRASGVTDTKFIDIPSVGGRKFGADDYIKFAGAPAFFSLVKSAPEIVGGQTAKELKLSKDLRSTLLQVPRDISI